MANGFEAGVQALATAFLVLLWLLSEVAIRVIARSKGSPRRVGFQRDRGSGALIVVSFVAIFVAAYLYPLDAFWGILPLWVRVLGDALMVLGIVVRVWAVRVLGKFFTSIVTIQGGHKLVEEGPYRVVRHPSYTGAILTTFGFVLAVGGLPVVLLAVGLVPIAFGYRIWVEERALVQGLGLEYRRYMGRTKRLFPGIL